MIDGGRLVKTTRFRRPVYVGDPINAVRIFNEKEVDELIVLDIAASRERRDPDFPLIQQLAGECFMPFTYGGGVRSVDQAARVFSAGVEKIALQTSVITDGSLIEAIASRFGSQSVVGSVDVKRSILGKHRLYAAARRQTVGKPWVQHARDLVNSGCGEILLNSVDRDGTLSGPDLELIGLASRSVSVPVVAVGGISSLEDIRKSVGAGASAVAAGAYFVFHGPHRAVLITYPKYKDLEALFAQ